MDSASRNLKNNVLLVLNGWAGTIDLWTEFLDYFSDDFEIEFLNWNDLIKSSINQRIEDLLIEYRNKDKRIFICAWSLGSILGLELLNKDIDGAIFMSSSYKFIKEDSDCFGWDISSIDKMKESLYKDKELVLKSFYQKMFAKSEDEFFKKAWNNSKDEILKLDLKELCLGLDFLKEEDKTRFIKDIGVRSIFIHGRNDRICLLEKALKIQNQNSLVGLSVIEDCGHIPFYTKTKEIVELVDNYIRRMLCDR